MKLLTAILFVGWSGALLLLGGVGVFTARWELERIFQVDLQGMGPAAAAGLLNQYRFLKALEFAVGFLCLTYWREIFRLPAVNRLFVWVVGLGAAARVLSLLFDGMPQPPYVGVTVFEVLTFLVVLAYSRRVVQPS